MVDMKSKDQETVFVFKGDHNTLVNSIRRTILDDVPTMAIEDVEVIVNDSPLYDETVAHRLGLVPLTTDLKSYNFKSECKCGGIGCALCEVKMSLESDKEGYVLSGEIKSDDPKVVPADKEIPVTKLFSGKKVEMNLKAELGRGRDHAKWSPAHAYLKEGKGTVELHVEAFGQLSAKDVFNRAIDEIVSKIEELEVEFK